MNNIISFNKLNESRNKNELNIIIPQEKIVKTELAEEHDAQPIKKIEDIIKIKKYLLDNGKYRDFMLFIIGINTGLRCSDLRGLRFCDLITESCEFRDEIVVFETKTRNTRTVKKNRHITINDAVKDAVTIYLKNNENVMLTDYLFTSESSNADKTKPISRQAIQSILTATIKGVGLDLRTGTHMLRKTFAYHTIVSAQDRPRAMELLQKILGHSSMATTMCYAGITTDEINGAYKNLNLGLDSLDNDKIIAI